MREPIMCPKCGEQLLGTVNVTYCYVPIYADGYHGSDGEHTKSELVKVYCPKCNKVEIFIDWDEGKALAEEQE